MSLIFVPTRNTQHSKMNIALVTCDNFHELLTEDVPLREELIALGHHAVSVSWSDKSADWTQFDLVIIRSTWDYYKRFDAFNQWMDMLESKGIPTWNPIALMRWNSNKTYLRDLEAKGIEIVPTEWVDRNNDRHLSTILLATGWEKAILKPAISGGSYLTVPIDASNTDEHQATLQQILTTGPAMIQPFLPEIVSVGEYSLLYFGGEYQFTILKAPKDGDYRVQQEFGGSTRKVQPTAEQLATANKIMQAIDHPTLYARVDGVQVNGRFQLMELELIEPHLYMEYEPGSLQKFAAMIGDWVL